MFQIRKLGFRRSRDDWGGAVRNKFEIIKFYSTSKISNLLFVIRLMGWETMCYQSKLSITCTKNYVN